MYDGILDSLPNYVLRTPSRGSVDDIVPFQDRAASVGGVKLHGIWAHCSVYLSLAAGNTLRDVHWAKYLQSTSFVNSGDSVNAAVLGKVACPWALCFRVYCGSHVRPNRVDHKLESSPSCGISGCPLVQFLTSYMRHINICEAAMPLLNQVKVLKCGSSHASVIYLLMGNYGFASKN